MKKNNQIKISQKRSLKRRIKKIMNLTNLISVFITCIFLYFWAHYFISTIGDQMLTYTANQLSQVISNEAENDSDLRKFLNEINPGSLAAFEMGNYTQDVSSDLKVILDDHSILDINIIQYRVWMNESLVYDSMTPKEYDMLNNNGIGIDISEFFSKKVEKNILSSDNTEIGKIVVRFNPISIMMFYSSIIGIGILLLIANGIVVRLLSTILSKLVIHPLTTLHTEMEKIAEGDIDPTFRNELSMKKPLIEVHHLITSTNKIMSKMSEYSSLLTSQKDELESQNEELEAQRDELERQNSILAEREIALKSINTAYIGKTIKLQNLLNNVGQGFLTINKDQIINPEYSQECERMLSNTSHKKLSGQRLSESLFMNSGNEEFVSELINKIFECDSSQKELYLSLLPEEVTLNSTILKISYKIVYDDHHQEQLMIILTDITQTRQLEKQMNEERNILQMIVKVLLNREECINIINEYKEFAKKDFYLLAETQYEEVLREIHTYKGVFSQYYMENTTTALNDLENQLSISENLNIMKSITYYQLVDPLNLDIDVIEGYVGNEFLFCDDTYTIKEEKIIEIEHKIRRLLPSIEYNKVLPIIKSLRYKSLKDILKTYPDYTQKLAQRLGKNIHPFSIEGDDIYIDYLIYQPVLKTLVHVFRNSVDHGIEDEDQRIEHDKDQFANIRCEVQDLGDGFIIAISDDGQGINTEKLIHSAKTKGLIHENSIVSGNEALNLIFLDGLTTKEEATAISGRGVGLSAVKHAVEAISGTITFETEYGQGTTVKIYLPYQTYNQHSPSTPDNIFKHIVQIAEDFFKQLGIDSGTYQYIKTNKIALNNINALISIKGSIDAILILSIDETLGKLLVKSFMLEPIDDLDITNYMEDVLGEISNTILGNALNAFENDGIYLSIGVPAMISNKDAYVKYTDSQILCIVHDTCSFSINLIIIDSENILV